MLATFVKRAGCDFRHTDFVELTAPLLKSEVPPSCTASGSLELNVSRSREDGATQLLQLGVFVAVHPLRTQGYSLFFGIAAHASKTNRTGDWT